MHEYPENYLAQVMLGGVSKGDIYRVAMLTTGKTPLESCNWFEFYKVVATSEEASEGGIVPVVHLLPLCTAVKITRRIDEGQFVMGFQKVLPKLAGTRFVEGKFNKRGSLIINGVEARKIDLETDSLVMHFKVRERSGALRHAKDGGYIMWDG